MLDLSFLLIQITSTEPINLIRKYFSWLAKKEFPHLSIARLKLEIVDHWGLGSLVGHFELLQIWLVL